MRVPYLLTMMVLLVLWAMPAYAGGPALGKGVELQTRDATANRVLNNAIQPNFWSSASKNDYEAGRYLYDSIWLRWVEPANDRPGYVVLITGTGNENFNQGVVSDIIINKQDRIDNMFSRMRQTSDTDAKTHYTTAWVPESRTQGPGSEPSAAVPGSWTQGVTGWGSSGEYKIQNRFAS